MTTSQELLVKMMNLYPDDTFIEIIESLDDPEFWSELDPVEDIDDDTCIELCVRLSNCYRDWNYA